MMHLGQHGYPPYHEALPDEKISFVLFLDSERKGLVGYLNERVFGEVELEDNCTFAVVNLVIHSPLKRLTIGFQCFTVSDDG